eukprot:12347107-Alexandrium_andersonii.AAC.1
MSASLVGSEMCIRDRPLVLELQRSVPVDLVQNARADDRRPSCLDVEPVSYTHLTLPTICSV